MRRRKNPYTSILRPVAIGRGAPEVSCVLIYDIENDRLRTRISEACLDYGLRRIQYSAFFGKLNRNRREELTLRLRKEVAEQAAKIRIIPVCQADLDGMWVFEQERPAEDAGPPTLIEAQERMRPRLKVVDNTE